MAKNLLTEKKIPFEEVDVTGKDELRRQLQEETGWMTVPIVMIGDEVIGGFDELSALDDSGQLSDKLS